MQKEPLRNITIVPEKTSATFKDGEIVFVRVVEDKGNGTYTASFAGNRFSVRSHSPLEIGSSFKAQLEVESSLIKLTPLLDFTSESIQVQSNADFLNAIGLPADTLSLRLVQLFQQFSIKINIPLALKARTLAKLFPGQEKEAGEAVLFLADKDIEPTKEMIALILRLCKTPIHFDQKDKDTLSLINHKKGSSLHWIILPFNSTENMSGVLKLLIDTDSKKTQKFLLDCLISGKKYTFVLYYDVYTKSGKKNILEYCSNPPLNNAERRSQTEVLKTLVPRDFVTKVCYVQTLDKDGLFTKNKDLAFIRRTV